MGDRCCKLKNYWHEQCQWGGTHWEHMSYCCGKIHENQLLWVCPCTLGMRGFEIVLILKVIQKIGGLEQLNVER